MGMMGLMGIMGCGGAAAYGEAGDCYGLMGIMGSMGIMGGSGAAAYRETGDCYGMDGLNGLWARCIKIGKYSMKGVGVSVFMIIFAIPLTISLFLACSTRASNNLHAIPTQPNVKM